MQALTRKQLQPSPMCLKQHAFARSMIFLNRSWAKIFNSWMSVRREIRLRRTSSTRYRNRTSTIRTIKGTALPCLFNSITLQTIWLLSLLRFVSCPCKTKEKLQRFLQSMTSKSGKLRALVRDLKRDYTPESTSKYPGSNINSFIYMHQSI